MAVAYQAMFWHLSPPVATCHLSNSTYFLSALSLVLLPSSILPYHRSNQLLHLLTNKSNTYTEDSNNSNLSGNTLSTQRACMPNFRVNNQMIIFQLTLSLNTEHAVPR